MALASSGAALATLRTALRWAAESAYAACTPPAFAWAVAATPPAFDTCANAARLSFSVQTFVR